MSHDAAVLLLTNYLAGRLTGAEREAVRAHVESCGECRGLAEVHQVLSRAPLRKDGHPAASWIVGFALHYEGLTPDEGQEIDAHVRECRQCSEEVDRVRAVEATAGRRPAAGWRGSSRLALAAAFLIVATLAYEIGARRAPTTEQPRPTPGPVVASGLLRIQPLPAPRRGVETTRRTLTLLPGETSLFVSLDLPELPATEEGSAFRFDLIAPSGDVAWSLEISGTDLVQRAAWPPGVVLAVPTKGISDGLYTMRLRGSEPGAPVLLEIPFLVEMYTAR